MGRCAGVAALVRGAGRLRLRVHDRLRLCDGRGQLLAWSDQNNIQLNQVLPNGTYHVYLWAMESYASNKRHWSLSADKARGARYLMAAGDWARALYANDDAIRHYSRALQTLID